MSIKLKEIDVINCTYWFFNDMINIKNLDQIELRYIKSHEKMFLFTTMDIRRSKVIA